MLPPNSTVTVHTSTLRIDCGDGYEVPADWYIPDTAEPPTRLIYLQHGLFETGPWYSYTAAALAEQTNSIVVAPTITSNFLSCDACWLGAPPMQQAVANLFEDDNTALAESALAAGYTGPIPDRVVLGQRHVRRHPRQRHLRESHRRDPDRHLCGTGHRNSASLVAHKAVLVEPAAGARTAAERILRVRADLRPRRTNLRGGLLDGVVGVLTPKPFRSWLRAGSTTGTRAPTPATTAAYVLPASAPRLGFVDLILNALVESLQNINFAYCAAPIGGTEADPTAS
jgi:hypothetical protein